MGKGCAVKTRTTKYNHKLSLEISNVTFICTMRLATRRQSFLPLRHRAWATTLSGCGGRPTQNLYKHSLTC